MALHWKSNLQVPVVERLDNAIQRVNHYPAAVFNKTNQAIHCIVIHPVDSVIYLSNNRGLAEKNDEKRQVNLIRQRSEETAEWKSKKFRVQGTVCPAFLLGPRKEYFYTWTLVTCPPPMDHAIWGPLVWPLGHHISNGLIIIIFY